MFSWLFNVFMDKCVGKVNAYFKGSPCDWHVLVYVDDPVLSMENLNEFQQMLDFMMHLEDIIKFKVFVFHKKKGANHM